LELARQARTGDFCEMPPFRSVRIFWWATAGAHGYHRPVKRWRAVVVAVVLLLAGGVALYWLRDEWPGRRFIPQIQDAARRYGVDPLLVKAVVWRESRFRPDRRGRKGEIGLMQIQEISAQEWADAEHVAGFGHERCLDPGTNTLAGTFYLGKLIKRYAAADNPVPYALADYNAGRSNVLRWNRGAAATNSAIFVEQIGFPGTKAYVKSVMRRYALYRMLSRIGW
jgi:soluble lytic murein transglycosylase